MEIVSEIYPGHSTASATGCARELVGPSITSVQCPVAGNPASYHTHVTRPRNCRKQKLLPRRHSVHTRSRLHLLRVRPDAVSHLLGAPPWIVATFTAPPSRRRHPRPPRPGPPATYPRHLPQRLPLRHRHRRLPGRTPASSPSISATGSRCSTGSASTTTPAASSPTPLSTPPPEPPNSAQKSSSTEPTPQPRPRHPLPRRDAHRGPTHRRRPDGYSQRYGLTWVDFRNQKRTLKDSALWSARVAVATA